jgi:glycosidase
VFNHVARSFPAVDELARRQTDGSVATFEGHDHLVVLDHDDPRVVDHVAGVMDHWLSRGVDGWRLDAAYAVAPRFWRDVLSRVRARHPQAWFMAEMIHGDYAGYVAESTVDSVTQYELWKAIWSSLNDRNFFELAYALKRHDVLLDTFVPHTFVGNHDVTRIATRLKDPATLPLALVVLLTVAGIPGVYAGDEQAFTGTKEDRAGGDDAVRPEFPDHPDGLSSLGADTHRLHQRLIGQRRRHAWLVKARTQILDVTNTRITYTSRGQRDQSLTVTLDLESPQPIWSVQ